MTMQRLRRIVLAGLLSAAPGAGMAGAAEPPPRASVIFFGDSLTAGYGLDPAEAYPALVQQKIDAAGLPFDVINAGLSGETAAAGARRVAWVLRRPAAVFVLALGGNDGLRGVPTSETERSLQAIIDTVRRLQPRAKIVLAGMFAPPNMGPEFTASFGAIFPRLARANDLPLIPFLLEGVATVDELNLPDGIHPNARGQRIVAENVWIVLEGLLRERSSARS